AEISRENPIELIDRTRLRNGELAMYVAYGGRDEFNIDAQVESFLYLCKFRGITVAVGYDPIGQHDLDTAKRLLPDIYRWLSTLLAPYAPPMYLDGGRHRERRALRARAGEEAGMIIVPDPAIHAAPPREDLPPPT